MNVQQLKNSILQEAIMGKLVPQDPNDEPASVLLDKIRKEKARLVKEGKLKKKDLEETPISEDEKPFEIPESWEWVRIKSILSMQAGKNVTSSDINSEQNDIFKYPCYGGNGLRGYVKEYNNEGTYPLVGRQGALCGNVNMAHGQFWATEHAVVSDGWGMTDVKWQYFFLIALNLNKYATATAQPGLAVSNIIEVPVPLPPLAEQHRIVAKIEELLPKVEEYGKAQEALDKLNEELPEKLKKSILQEAISGKLVPQDPNDEPASVLLDKIRKEKARLVKEGKLKKKDLEETPISEDEIPFEIPENWTWVRLKVLCDSFIVPQRDKPTKFDGDIPWCRIEDIEGKYLNGSKSNQLVTKELAESMNMHLCPKGTVICACSASIGNQAITTVDCYTNQTFIGIVCKDYALFNEYLYYFFMSQKQALKDLGKGTTISYISRKKFEDYLFPLPPLAEQRRIVAKIEQLMKEIDKLKK